MTGRSLVAKTTTEAKFFPGIVPVTLSATSAMLVARPAAENLARIVAVASARGDSSPSLQTIALFTRA